MRVDRRILSGPGRQGNQHVVLDTFVGHGRRSTMVPVPVYAAARVGEPKTFDTKTLLSLPMGSEPPPRMTV